MHVVAPESFIERKVPTCSAGGAWQFPAQLVQVLYDLRPHMPQSQRHR